MHVELRHEEGADDRERPPESQKPRLIGAIALRSLRARTTKTPMTEAKMPMAGTISGIQHGRRGLWPMVRKAE